MKKTISVNLANRNFYIEEDAYHVLDQYIKGIREYYKVDDPEGEIVEDFELRMGEIFHEKVRLGHEVITLELTKEVIKQMGRIEDLEEPDVSPDDDAEEPNTDRSKWKQGAEAFTVKLEKKLYRDPKNKWLGGVIAGLAVIFDVDVSLLRLITVLLLFTPLFWLVLILYLAGWIFLPAAETVSDRLKMEGKPLNSENLWHTISRDNPDINKGAQIVEESPKKKSNNWLWWGLAVLIIIGIICMLAWAASYFVGSPIGDMDYWLQGDFMKGSVSGVLLGVMIALLVVFLVFLFIVGIIALIYVVPIGLILRSSSLGGIGKVLLIVLWLTLTGGWIIFL